MNSESASRSMRFYNMLVHLTSPGHKVIEENVAVKNIWQKNSLVFLDLYFYRTKKSHIVDSVYLRDIMDMSNEKFYASAKEFIADYCAYTAKSEHNQPEEEPTQSFDFRYLEKIKDNLIILTFIAKCTADFNQVKLASIRKYINKKLPHTKTLSEQYLNNYMDALKPDETSFFKAVDNLKSKTPEEVEEVIKEALKISAADGILSYQERYYIAEIVQALREYDMEPDIEF